MAVLNERILIGRQSSERFGVAGTALAAAMLAATCFASSALAQTKPPAAAPATEPAAGAASGDAGLKARVESLEEQLVDMQVVVGTLESMSKQGGAARPQVFPSSATGGEDAGRIEGLETQIRALTAEVQRLGDQVRGLGGTPRRSEVPTSDPYAETSPPPPASAGDDGFGSTTVTSGAAAGTGDPIGGLIDRAPTAQPGAAPLPANTTFGGQPPPVATAALAPANDGADPKQLYETAYGYLLQRDYAAAEASFDDFLKRFPNDSLAGNAQYWLGESHFVRGQYKAAASAFLKGYQTYGQSSKAPDSLLKLAMSLDRLGQKDAACSSYAELTSKFPDAPQSVTARARSERQRVGCP